MLILEKGILTDKQYRLCRKYIRKAIKNGWNPEAWPLSDALFEIDCCLGVPELLADTSFQKAIGGTEYCNLVYKLVDRRYS